MLKIKLVNSMEVKKVNTKPALSEGQISGRFYTFIMALLVSRLGDSIFTFAIPGLTIK